MKNLNEEKTKIKLLKKIIFALLNMIGHFMLMKFYLKMVLLTLTEFKINKHKIAYYIFT